MASWQSRVVKSLLRVRKFESRFIKEWDIPKLRVQMERRAQALKLPRDFTREPVTAGGVSGEWIVPPNAAPGRVLYYLHGGAYSVGSITTHRWLIGQLARAGQARALAIDYRLAPEHPFPAALEDAVAGYRWLVAQGYDPSHIAIAGDSAGGGLTLATLIYLRDAGDPLPGAAVCLSPWTDLAATGNSLQTRARTDPWFDPSGVPKTARVYLADADPWDPLASPLYADLHGLPPLLIQVGECEILLSDSTRLAEKARAAGVDVTLEVWNGMFHVWQIFAWFVPEGRQAIERIGEFLKQKLASRQSKEAAAEPVLEPAGDD